MTFPTRALNLFDGTRTIASGFIGMLEGIFTDTVTRLAPILAPLPPAFSVYTAMSLRTPQWVAIATALAIELIGMFSSKVAVATWNWNKQRLKTEPRAPFRLALTMAAIYFIVVFALALGIEISPGFLIAIYPGFVLIAVSVYVSNAVATDLSAWQRERDERIQQQQERRGLSAEIKAATEQLAEIKADLEATQAEARDLVEAATAELEAIRTEATDLTESVTKLKAQKRRLATQIAAPTQADKPVSPDDPPAFSAETIARAKDVYDRFTAEGRSRFGAALGREVGVNDRNGRKLVEYFRSSLNGDLNDEVTE